MATERVGRDHHRLLASWTRRRAISGRPGRGAHSCTRPIHQNSLLMRGEGRNRRHQHEEARVVIDTPLPFRGTPSSVVPLLPLLPLGVPAAKRTCASQRNLFGFTSARCILRSGLRVRESRNRAREAKGTRS